MYVNHSGWNAEHGCFNYDIFVDETKQDHEIHYADGSIARQTSPFESVEADWNNDGDVYSLIGAWFRKSPNGPSEFWTPQDLVMALIDFKDGERSVCGRNIVSVTGITIPDRDKRPTLSDTIRQSENRALHQEIERNRAMDRLSIRPSNEPWAR